MVENGIVSSSGFHLPKRSHKCERYSSININTSATYYTALHPDENVQPVGESKYKVNYKNMKYSMGRYSSSDFDGMSQLNRSNVVRSQCCNSSHSSTKDRIHEVTQLSSVIQCERNASQEITSCLPIDHDHEERTTNNSTTCCTNPVNTLSVNSDIYGHSNGTDISSSLLTIPPHCTSEHRSPQSENGNPSCFNCCSQCLLPKFCRCIKPKPLNNFLNKDFCTAIFRRTFKCSLLPISFAKCCFFSHFSHHKLPNENLLVLSTIQVLCGFSAIILSTVALTKAVFLYRMATGLWAGLLMLITGIHGLCTARRPIMCMMMMLLVLSMLVSLATCVLICVSVAGTIEDGILNKGELRSEYLKISTSRKNFSTISQSGHRINYSLNNHSLVLITRSPRLKYYSDLQSTDFKYTHSASDTHLRTCKIILHILLLLVGILEASVSLASSILCCRCLCLNSGSFSFQNSHQLRTNIVSFDVETANRAVSVMRSGIINNFAGPGNVLLAVDTNTPFEFISTGIGPPQITPKIHHTLIPFLTDLNQDALLLTQAESGSVALAAACATANLIKTVGKEPIPSLDNTRRGEGDAHGRTTEFLKRILNNSSTLRHWGRSNRTRRPRLLYTSFKIPSTQADPIANTTTQCGTMVYVIPSPTGEEPAIILPPFPPSYNESQKKLTSTSVGTEQSRNDTAHRSACSSRNRGNPFCSRLLRTNRLNPFPNVLPHILSQCVSRSPQNAHYDSALTARSASHSRNGRHYASAPIMVGDRLIQPVLVIGNSDLPVNEGQKPSPPQYSESND